MLATLVSDLSTSVSYPTLSPDTWNIALSLWLDLYIGPNGWTVHCDKKNTKYIYILDYVMSFFPLSTNKSNIIPNALISPLKPCFRGSLWKYGSLRHTYCYI